ncbi:nuclear pore complex protein [Trifolium pratense]|uniref:Nuclear pore complex protein n=1 Tax=Trifolium pratense TaxID=57577 RepID=A0A2K3KP29_TRIPR|nr:nuclear pore complex protein [Trifolium pratense]
MRMTVEPSYSPTPTPKEELEWLPLPKHPLFTTTTTTTATTTTTSSNVTRNLLAFDEINNRLYFWDTNNNRLHRLSLRLGDPDPTSVLAASPSKVLQTDVVLDFDVNKISINRNGTAILLFGSQRLSVMYLYGRTSKKDVNLICR